MKLELYDYQKIAVGQMKNGCILCGGVGSGKSITSLAYYLKMDHDCPLYIITTAKKRDSNEWESECSKVGIEATKIDSWNNIRKYCNVCNSFFIFDEQRVVGYGAWSKAFIQISKKNHWILLSATPGDQWIDYAPVFIANGFYKNMTEFKHRHVMYAAYSKFPKIQQYLDEKHLQGLRDSILIDMDYVKHTVPHNIYLKADYNVVKYKSAMKLRWNVVKGQPIKNISELCYVLRYICNSDESREMLLEEVTIKHPKVIVFYNFDYELEILRKVATRLSIPYAEWNGHKHMEIPKTGRWLYLVQYSAGSEGWNCTSTNAMLFYSQSYSYKTTVQAAGRIDRTNSPFTDLYYYYIKSSAPIDIAIYRTLKHKKAFNERAYFKGLGLA